MEKKTLGAMLMAVGGGLVLLSIGLVLGGGGSEASALPSTTSRPSATTSLPVTSTSSTTIPETTTTTTAATTTTVPSTAARVAAFVVQFASAIDSGDSEFVLSRLHPDIVDGFGESACRQWVENEVMALSEYIAVQAPQGPTEGTLETPIGTLEFDNRYSVEVTFVFGGQEFASTADFVVSGTNIYFTGSCES